MLGTSLQTRLLSPAMRHVNLMFDPSSTAELDKHRRKCITSCIPPKVAFASPVQREQLPVTVPENCSGGASDSFVELLSFHLQYVQIESMIDEQTTEDRVVVQVDS